MLEARSSAKKRRLEIRSKHIFCAPSRPGSELRAHSSLTLPTVLARIKVFLPQLCLQRAFGAQSCLRWVSTQMHLSQMHLYRRYIAQEKFSANLLHSFQDSFISSFRWVTHYRIRYVIVAVEDWTEVRPPEAVSIASSVLYPILHHSGRQ